jgi:hypothetical protein
VPPPSPGVLDRPCVPLGGLKRRGPQPRSRLGPSLVRPVHHRPVCATLLSATAHLDRNSGGDHPIIRRAPAAQPGGSLPRPPPIVACQNGWSPAARGRPACADPSLRCDSNQRTTQRRNPGCQRKPRPHTTGGVTTTAGAAGATTTAAAGAATTGGATTTAGAAGATTTTGAFATQAPSGPR